MRSDNRGWFGDQYNETAGWMRDMQGTANDMTEALMDASAAAILAKGVAKLGARALMRKCGSAPPFRSLTLAEPIEEGGFIGDFGKPPCVANTTATAAKDVTYLYQKVGAHGEHLKFGITKNPATRYTQQELGGGQLRILTEGPRKEMLQLERNLHETLPIGPDEGQNFYIQKQIEKGLKQPPYNP